ncbi:flagellar biosynthetic protein FliR [Mangrovitalea sediminis]|uniref:flagellar biosynthetic protein FliR n=1 Tax=Mangrovitalea sediminis TaxID=1982043 RepID=UPI000BE5AC38|nr:flagellar biosynthetic protein FliR [Mangrovitalea sediminis]
MQPLVVNAPEIGQWVGRYLWPLFRIGSFLMVVPVIGTALVPMRVRVGLALLITILIQPMIGAVPKVDALSLAATVITLQQILIGTAMGFAVLMLFQLFVIAGQMMAMQMGLGFASMVDPTNGISVPAVSQFYLISITLLYLAMNGHLVVFDVFLESFRTMPISESGLGTNHLWELVHHITWMFSAALLLALPAITAVMIVNISFGVMTKAAPQMNLFSLGFPIALLFGLFSIWVLEGDFLPHFQRLSEDTFAFMRHLQGLP